MNGHLKQSNFFDLDKANDAQSAELLLESSSSSSTFLPAAMVMGLCLLTLLLQGITFAYVRHMARQPPPTLVQTLDGRSLQFHPIPHNERSPAAIKAFTYRVLTQLFTATGVVPDGEGGLVEDRQFSVEGRPVTTAAWAASHALSSDFNRPSMLKGITEITPAAVFDDRQQVEIHLEILTISSPKPVAEGAWQVDVVATRSVVQNGVETDRYPFNKSIFIRAVEPYRMPPHPTATSLAMNEYRGGGMEIYAIDGLRLAPIVDAEE